MERSDLQSVHLEFRPEMSSAKQQVGKLQPLSGTNILRALSGTESQVGALVDLSHTMTGFLTPEWPRMSNQTSQSPKALYLSGDFEQLIDKMLH